MSLPSSPVVGLLILLRRPAVKVEEYSSVWTDEGSPLIVTSRKVQDALQERFEFPVELAMNYAKPTIAGALGASSQNAGVTDLFIMPLYLHYAMSSYEIRGGKNNVSDSRKRHPFKNNPKAPPPPSLFMLTQIISMPYMRFRVPIWNLDLITYSLLFMACPSGTSVKAILPMSTA